MQVGASESGLVVWNLLTAGVHWAAPLSVSALAADPVHTHFAVAIVSRTQQAQQAQQAQQEQAKGTPSQQRKAARIAKAGAVAADHSFDQLVPVAGSKARLAHNCWFPGCYGQWQQSLVVICQCLWLTVRQ